MQHPWWADTLQKEQREQVVHLAAGWLVGTSRCTCSTLGNKTQLPRARRQGHCEPRAQVQEAQFAGEAKVIDCPGNKVDSGTHPQHWVLGAGGEVTVLGCWHEHKTYMEIAETDWNSWG